MDVGYIKLYRKITNSFVWTHPQMFKLWCLCLMKASHKENKFLFNGSEIVVSSGQFVTGRDAIAKEFNEGVKSDQAVVGRTLWRWLKKFEEEQMLSIVSNTKYSVVTINNWTDYQVSDQHLSSARPSSVQRSSTYKNEKNLKNDNNIIINNPLRFYESNGYGSIAPLTIQKIEGWVSDITKTGTSEEEANQIIIRAMEFGVTNNKRTWNYVNKILINWEQRGLNTIDKIEAAEAERQASQQEKPAKQYRSNNSHARQESLPNWAGDDYEEPEDEVIDDTEFKKRLERIRARGGAGE